jgi:hypothetical protein
MNKIEKLKAISSIPADAEADISLINKYSLKELTPEGVFCFSIILCDNEVDRDNEYFTTDSLEKLGRLFLGKTVIFDHRWSAEKQVARLYRTFTEDVKGKTDLGEPKRVLRGSAYMLRSEASATLIEAIEGGILKEVSVGCSISSATCSICGGKMSWSTCENGHKRGEKYEDKLCCTALSEPTDAYEVSFVAVPAQREAGVTKGAKDSSSITSAFFELLDSGSISPEELNTAKIKILSALEKQDERDERTLILSKNKQFIGE